MLNNGKFLFGLLLGLLLVACGTGTPPDLDAEGVQVYPSGNVYYLVQPGDTITAISKQVNVSKNQLLKLNRLEEDTVIYPGQVLIIGYADEETAAAFVATQKANPPLGSGDLAPRNFPGIIIYQVQEGDTLVLIADMFYLPVEEIIEVNRLDENAEIYVGQELHIPANDPDFARLDVIKVNQILIEVSEDEDNPGIFVTIHGELPDTCTQFWTPEISLSQDYFDEGFLIRLQPFRYDDGNCEEVPQDFTYYRIELHYGILEPGEYTVSVNGVAEETFTITEEHAPVVTLSPTPKP